jgi:DNA-binding NarL/FixJ family response regulator
MREPTSDRRDQPDALTSLEREIAALVAEGLADAEIADRLDLPEATISAHIEAAMRTLAVRSRLKLALWASGRGLGGVY